jgi:hypothetical protein
MSAVAQLLALTLTRDPTRQQHHRMAHSHFRSQTRGTRCMAHEL